VCWQANQSHCHPKKERYYQGAKRMETTHKPPHYRPLCFSSRLFQESLQRVQLLKRQTQIRQYKATPSGAHHNSSIQQGYFAQLLSQTHEQLSFVPESGFKQLIIS